MVMGPITDMELNLNSKLHERTIIVPIVCLNNLLLSRVKIQSTNISKYIDMDWTILCFYWCILYATFLKSHVKWDETSRSRQQNPAVKVLKRTAVGVGCRYRNLRNHESPIKPVYLTWFSLLQSFCSSKKIRFRLTVPIQNGTWPDFQTPVKN